MWSSIKNIDIPTSFKQANEYQSKSKSVLLGGGTYLVAEKNPKIQNLIDINNIVNKTIEITDDSIIIGAGATIQDMINKLTDYSLFTEAVKYSCFSKNIRNQRTIGGEIA